MNLVANLDALYKMEYDEISEAIEAIAIPKQEKEKRSGTLLPQLVNLGISKIGFGGGIKQMVESASNFLM